MRLLWPLPILMRRSVELHGRQHSTGVGQSRGGFPDGLGKPVSDAVNPPLGGRGFGVCGWVQLTTSPSTSTSTKRLARCPP